MTQHADGSGEVQIPAGMVAWHGGDSAPEDWVGYGPGGEASWPHSPWPSTVLYRDGTTGSPEPKVGRWRHKGAHGWDGGNYDIIAYTPAPARTNTPAGDAEARAREVATRYYGYDNERDLAYWGNASHHRDVERLAAALARHAAEAVAAERERCAQVADDASDANLNRSNELRRSSDPIDGEYSVAFHRKHREAQAIATAIREQAK